MAHHLNQIRNLIGNSNSILAIRHQTVRVYCDHWVNSVNKITASREDVNNFGNECSVKV